MADQPILAAGGIVVRGNTRPTVALVQLRKDGGLGAAKGQARRRRGCSSPPREREVHEETGQTVTVQEFVGTLCYEVNGRPKIVQFWRMHPNGGPARELMSDIKQVAWLPLEKAIRKLARPHERGVSRQRRTGGDQVASADDGDQGRAVAEPARGRSRGACSDAGQHADRNRRNVIARARRNVVARAAGLATPPKTQRSLHPRARQPSAIHNDGDNPARAFIAVKARCAKRLKQSVSAYRYLGWTCRRVRS